MYEYVMPDKVYHMAHQINAIIGYMPYLIAGWGDMGYDTPANQQVKRTPRLIRKADLLETGKLWQLGDCLGDRSGAPRFQKVIGDAASEHTTVGVVCNGRYHILTLSKSGVASAAHLSVTRALHSDKAFESSTAESR